METEFRNDVSFPKSFYILQKPLYLIYHFRIVHYSDILHDILKALKNAYHCHSPPMAILRQCSVQPKSGQPRPHQSFWRGLQQDCCIYQSPGEGAFCLPSTFFGDDGEACCCLDCLGET